MDLGSTQHGTRRTKYGSRNTKRIILTKVLLFLYALGAAHVHAQQVEGSNFKVADLFDAPNERQIKSLIEGARWRQQGSQTAVYDARVHRFRTNGVVELIIEAPECFYDDKQKAVNSAGPVQFRTADGQFSLSGMGFLWLQTNSTLYISNQVKTIVLSTNSPAETNKGITVFSDRFQYARDSGVGIYSGNVRAVGTNVSLNGKSEVMEVLIPVAEHQLQTITMTDKVALDYDNIEATGQRAVYTAATGLAKITGSPAWQDENQRQGSGDELVIDRTNKIFRANGQAWVKMPSQSMGTNAFLSSASSVKGTNQFVEIFSDHYEFRTNATGNFVRFGDHVRMVDTSNGKTNGTLTAATMLVTLLSTNELQSMVAEKNVVIQNETNRFTGEKAVYTATNGLLEMTGDPAWRSGARQGTGDVLVVNLRRSEMEVRTNAWMRVPASQLGPSIAMKQSSGVDARQPPVAPQSLSRSKDGDSAIKWPQMEPDPPTPRGARAKSPSTLSASSSTNEFADIYSETYTVATNSARFEGGVRIVHPRLNWVCKTMNVDSPSPNSKDVIMTAEEAVEFNLKVEDQSRDVHGTCNHAVYNYAVTPSGTNDTMTLTGNPILETTNSIFTNKVIILDCANNKLMAPGRYKLYGTNATTTPIPTNMFRIPTGKKK